MDVTSEIWKAMPYSLSLWFFLFVLKEQVAMVAVPMGSPM